MERFNIGEILYVLMSKNNSIVPVVVVKRITFESSEGETITYHVQDSTNKVSELNSSIETIFRTPEQAKKYLMTRAETAIDSIIAKAVVYAKELIISLSPSSKNNEVIHDEKSEQL